VTDFINAIDNKQKREDSFVILEMMKKATGENPVLWGSSIIGFGNKRYKSPASGREVDWMVIGFSPRKANLTLYVHAAMKEKPDLIKKLGKHKAGTGCLYINKLEDIDLKILEKIVKAAVDNNAGI
jgi:hypothetical protein